MGALFDTIRTYFAESREWLSILQGLWATFQISALSMLLGTLLALPLCLLRMSKRRLFSAPAQAYIAVVRGTPVLMLLMLFYYVVFQGSRIDATYIAVIAYSLNVAAHVAEVFRSALKSLNPGQKDAAFALGMNRRDIFLHVTLPQAIQVGLPVYQNAIVNLIQWTSVVGYISITDLSQAIKFVSSRTMQPLPLMFVGIALYLTLAYLVYGLFGLLGKRPFGASHRYDRRQRRRAA